MIVSLLAPLSVEAAESDVTLYMRPHCAEQELGESLLGPTPDIEPFIGLGTGICRPFAVLDPQTLQTDPLSVGNTLDIDIVVQNPSTQKIRRVRSWLSFDPEIVEGTLIEVNPRFPLVTPGEQDFDATNGFAMIEAAAEEGAEPDATDIAVARVRFTVLKAPPSGTAISFRDVQPGGNTEVVVRENGTEQYVIGTDPGTLFVVFAQLIEEVATVTDAESQEPVSTRNQIGDACLDSSDCESDNCANGICVAPLSNVADGGSCSNSNQCLSGLCVNTICTASIDTSDTTIPDTPPLAPAPTPPPLGEQTSFGLLQVQNLRVATEGSSAFLAWDPLQSSRLKGYNLYYGTISGQYLQRKTVSANTSSLTLRALSVGTTYYFSVRAISQQDEESAFSQEVAITIGDPNSSTSPLVASVFDQDIAPPPPINHADDIITVPGETGIPSAILLLLVLSSVIGTFLASKRQIVVTPVHLA